MIASAVVALAAVVVVLLLPNKGMTGSPGAASPGAGHPVDDGP